MQEKLAGKTIAILAGDRRVLEILRQARASGATVRWFACPPGAEEAAGVPAAASAKDAVKGANFILGPMPAQAPDEALFAPFSSEKVYLFDELLGEAAPNALLFLGIPTPKIMQSAKNKGVRVIPIADEDALMVIHAVPTAEGALKYLIELTDTTVLGLKCLVIGYGRVSISLAKILRALDADVTVCARQEAQLVRAWAAGYKTVHLSGLGDVIGDFDFVVSGASSPVLDRDLIARTRPDALIMELAAPPGSIDLAAAEQLKRRTVWPRGQASTAPRTVGYHEWLYMLRFMTNPA